MFVVCALPVPMGVCSVKSNHGYTQNRPPWPQIDHQPVIDTALIFSYKGLSQATPSLVHLAQRLLGKTLRTGSSAADGAGGSGDGSSGGGGSGGGGEGGAAAGQGKEGVHDSREDAGAALELVQYEVAREVEGKPTGQLEPPAGKVRAGAGALYLAGTNRSDL